jgi:hypothetical protein
MNDAKTTGDVSFTAVAAIEVANPGLKGVLPKGSLLDKGIRTSPAPLSRSYLLGYPNVSPIERLNLLDSAPHAYAPPPPHWREKAERGLELSDWGQLLLSFNHDDRDHRTQAITPRTLAWLSTSARHRRRRTELLAS